MVLKKYVHLKVLNVAQKTPVGTIWVNIAYQISGSKDMIYSGSYTI